MIDTQYIDIQWLKTYGLGKNNVLDYFYTSPFFDLTSNNELIRTQAVHPDHLVNLTGLEYALDPDIPDQPNLFVIRKQYRESPRKEQILYLYYCVDGIIYQCPELLQLVRSRINKTSHYLARSFELLQSSTSYSSRYGRTCWSDKQEQEITDVTSPDVTAEATMKDVATIENVVDSDDKNGNVPPIIIPEFPSFNRVLEDLRKSF